MRLQILYKRLPVVTTAISAAILSITYIPTYAGPDPLPSQSPLQPPSNEQPPSPEQPSPKNQPEHSQPKPHSPQVYGADLAPNCKENYASIILGFGTNGFWGTQPGTPDDKVKFSIFGLTYTICLEYNIRLLNSHFTLIPGCQYSMEKHSLSGNKDESTELQALNGSDFSSFNEVLRYNNSNENFEVKPISSSFCINYISPKLDLRWNEIKQNPKEGCFAGIGAAFGIIFDVKSSLNFKLTEKPNESNNESNNDSKKTKSKTIVEQDSNNFGMSGYTWVFRAFAGYKRFNLIYTHHLTSLFKQTDAPKLHTHSLTVAFDLF